MKKKILVFLSLWICLASSSVARAQYDDRDRHPYDFDVPNPPPGDGDDAPIDDFWPLLLFAAFGLGYYALYKRPLAKGN